MVGKPCFFYTEAAPGLKCKKPGSFVWFGFFLSYMLFMKQKYTREEKNALALRAQKGDQKAAYELLHSLEFLIRKFFKTSGAVNLCEYDDFQSEIRLAILEKLCKFDPNVEGKQSHVSGYMFYVIKDFSKAFVVSNRSKLSGLKRNRKIHSAAVEVSKLVSKGVSQEKAISIVSSDMKIKEQNLSNAISQNYYAIGEDYQNGEVNLEAESFDSVTDMSKKKAISIILSELSERQVFLLKCYYDDNVRLSDVAKSMGYTERYIRDLVKQAESAAKAVLLRHKINVKSIF